MNSLENTSDYTAGTTVKLSGASLYALATDDKESAKKSGTFYLWSDEVVNNRIRITNKKTNVGVEGQETSKIYIFKQDDIKSVYVSRNFCKSRFSYVTDRVSYYKERRERWCAFALGSIKLSVEK